MWHLFLGRNGTDSEGRRIWNVEDSIGNKMMKSVGHLVESQAPLNWKQLTRLGISMFPEDSKFGTPAGQLPPLVTAANTNVMNANATYGKIPTVVGKTTAEELNEVFTNNR
jgi:hypothetical protein